MTRCIYTKLRDIIQPKINAILKFIADFQLK